MIEFTGQVELRQQLIDSLNPMIPELEKWRDVWVNQLPDDKKIDWLIEGKSLFMSAAGGIFIYLLPYFESLVDDIQLGKIKLNLDDMTIRGQDG